MCDEYDDERMRAFWRVLAERESLVDLHVIETEGAGPIVKALGAELTNAAKPKAKTLAR